MQQYKGNFEKCPKCGHSAPKVKYEYRLSFDVLKLECCRCQYRWERKPLDQE